jgi:hypothetical protein
MTKFKLLAVATILSAAIWTPGIAQQAVQKPRLQPFYQTLGVGSSTSGADASYCAQRWAYYDPASGKAMEDDGQWRPCP